ncbi:MAG: hypothetical protein LBL32_00680, partial [Holosporales bacterium]|nr:hypothetical protein [Holosporales bacterium]
MTIKNRTRVGVTSAIVAVSNAAASGCPDGRFFVGGTLTANFDRATIKYDGDETNENIKKWTAAIQQKLQLYITAKEEAAKTIDEPAKDLAKIVGNVLQKWLEMDVEHRKILFAGDSDNPAGSALALSLTSVNTEINKTNI